MDVTQAGSADDATPSAAHVRTHASLNWALVHVQEDMAHAEKRIRGLRDRRDATETEAHACVEHLTKLHTRQRVIKSQLQHMAQVVKVAEQPGDKYLLLYGRTGDHRVYATQSNLVGLYSTFDAAQEAFVKEARTMPIRPIPTDALCVCGDGCTVRTVLFAADSDPCTGSEVNLRLVQLR
jgi:hypothetical protein